LALRGLKSLRVEKFGVGRWALGVGRWALDVGRLMAGRLNYCLVIVHCGLLWSSSRHKCLPVA
jgi:hypothetical protein